MIVSVRELKNHLSEYLGRVQNGEEVVVTSRNRPVARLVAVRPPPGNRAKAVRERLASVPWIRPGTGGKPRGSRHPMRTRPGEKTLAEIVIESRR